MTINLNEIFRINDCTKYKLHLPRSGGGTEPLNIWLRSEEEWISWQEHKPSRDDFNRDFIISFMKFFHENDTWLFGGVFEVLGKKDGKYVVKQLSNYEHYIGRLKITLEYKAQKSRINLENYFKKMVVKEILDEKYSGRSFVGLNNINLPLSELSTLIKQGHQNWRAPLNSIKGVYLVTDLKTMKKYVGSAYGNDGIWSRWKSYVESSHGGNKLMKELINSNGRSYAFEYFNFSLLEYFPITTLDEFIISRENHWKEILNTRHPNGLNKN